MNRDDIYRIALANGFKLKQQDDGTMNLNEYVYQFAQALLYEAGNEVKATATPDTAPPIVARQALAFARGHDWGRHARLEMTHRGRWQIVGLSDAFTHDGWYFDECCTIPATLSDARNFGGY